MGCRYNNYEGFNFNGYNGPFQEFPIIPGGVYTGGEFSYGAPKRDETDIDVGSPGPDRVVITEDSCRQAGTITHTGASGNNFVACQGTSK